MKTRTITLKADEFPTACDALQDADETGRTAIHIGGKYLVTTPDEVYRVEAMGVRFAIVGAHETPGGDRLVSIPVN